MTHDLRKILELEKKPVVNKRFNDVLNNNKWPNAVVPYTFDKKFCKYWSSLND